MALGPFSAKDHLEITSLGTEFALLEIVGAAVGYWLDKKLGTLPWCVLGGVFLGFALGMFRIVQAAKQKNTNLKGK
ncbi:MAG: AtpZ/AtpI family protein [Elusimicrobiaceae bacterium]|nr:AtpZ/AtpI family protein [Elusimicrobiaceae bacterium]MBP5616800.1 AtpZ/AtpI family protein [Elusimicrobiaceae bacterium]